MADTPPSPGDAPPFVKAVATVEINGLTANVRWTANKIPVWLRRYEHPRTAGRPKPKTMELRVEDDLPQLGGADDEPSTITMRVLIAGPSADVELAGARFRDWLSGLAATPERPRPNSPLRARITDVSRENLKSS